MNLESNHQMLSLNAFSTVLADAPSFFDIGDKLIQSIFIAFKGHHIDLIALFKDPNCQILSGF